jgi:cytochrome bd ubiquinol oxidase subunit I
MLLIGFLMAAVGLVSLWLRWRGRLYEARWFLRALVAMGPSGLVAVLCGWFTTEVGRQPYTVYGLLTTADSVAPIAAPAVAASLVAFVVVYFAVFGTGTAFLLSLMYRSVKPVEAPEAARAPIRTAGIAPGPAQGTTTEVTAGR